MARTEGSETSPAIPVAVGLVFAALGLVIALTQEDQTFQRAALIAIGLGIVGFLIGVGVAKMVSRIRHRD